MKESSRIYPLPMFFVLLWSVAGCSSPSTSNSLPLSSQTRTSFTTNLKMDDRAILSHLSPMLSQPERRYMYSELTHIAPRYRENVIVLDVKSGRLHANKPSLLAAASSWRNVPGKLGLMSDGHGHLMRVTVERVNGEIYPGNPNVCGGTGFCHSRYSDDVAEGTTHGFVWEDATVSIPCDSASLATGDTGNAYIGERDTSNADGNLATDAGIQIQFSGTAQSVQGFMLVSGTGVSFHAPPSKTPQHLVCPVTKADLTYNPPPHDPQHVVFVLTAPFLEGWNQVTFTGDLTGTGVSSPGNCPTCQVKVVTSIATSHLSGDDGSYMGVHGVNSSPTPEVEWDGAYKGYYDPNTGQLVNKGYLSEYGNYPSNLGAPPTALCIDNPINNDSSWETTGINRASSIPQSAQFCPM